MKQMVLLAVDDKAENLFLIKELVAEYLPECRVVTTQSPEEGLKIAAKEEIAVAVVDVQMPGIDGVEMCRRGRLHLEANLQCRNGGEGQGHAAYQACRG